MRVNCNISAVIANNQLVKSQDALDTAIERLSSGLKINHASDDAAGMAISKKMHAQIKSLEQSSRNTSDGISVVQTAESALGEVENMLQRARELCVQAADETYSDEDRASIQAEIDQIADEVNRISTDTEFNTMPLLDGTLSRKTYSDVSGVQMFSLSDAVATGKYSFTVTAEATQATITATSFTGTVTTAQAGTMTINGAEITIEEGDDFSDVYSKIVDGCSRSGITLECQDGLGNIVPPASATNLVFINSEYGAKEDLTIDFESASVAGLFSLSQNNVSAGDDCQVTLGSGFSPTAVVTTYGTMVTVNDVNTFSMKVDVPADPAISAVTMNVTELGIMSIQAGANEGQQIDIDIPAVNTYTLGIDNINVYTSAGASKALNQFDEAIAQVSAIRSKLGAYQNRMENTVSSIASYDENITAALSRIEDCDMAEEMTIYTSQNVISQAATSVMSQANERPQSVLQLLQ